jgi:hypothetical protein
MYTLRTCTLYTAYVYLHCTAPASASAAAPSESFFYALEHQSYHVTPCTCARSILLLPTNLSLQGQAHRQPCSKQNCQANSHPPRQMDSLGRSHGSSFGSGVNFATWYNPADYLPYVCLCRQPPRKINSITYVSLNFLPGRHEKGIRRVQGSLLATAPRC